jgi:hypothetical protein
LVASTSADASYLVIDVGGIAAVSTDTATLLDIGTGASGSETALIQNVAVGSASRGTGIGFVFGVPIKIASGTRLSARIQSVVAGGKTGTVIVRTFDMGDYAHAPTACDVIGTDTATSAGTAMTGASGTYAQVTASTANAYKAIVMVPSASSNNVGGLALQFTLASGASGSEVDLGAVNGVYSTSETAQNFGPSVNSPLLVGGPIAAGTRLAVKHNTGFSAAPYDITLIGIR